MPIAVGRMLRRIVQGDPAAAAWLYDAFAPRLLRRLRRRYPELDAEEMLHDSFLLCLSDGALALSRALAARGAGEVTGDDVERSLWDLACGIAANRRRAAALRRAAPLPDDPAAAAEPGPERESIARDAVQRLERCLAAKGGRAYLYFKLRYADGLSPQEIVRATGWSRKATYKLKQALDAAVRECVERLGLGGGRAASPGAPRR